MFDLLGDLNYLAVAVAALVYFVIGAIWYAPPVLGKTWQKLTGVTADQAQSPNPMLFVMTFVAYFIVATVLAVLARGLGATTVSNGLELGAFIGIGILGVLFWVNTAYEQRPMKLWLLTAANALLGTLAMSVIVTIWE